MTGQVDSEDPSRRLYLTLAGVLGVGLVVLGAAVATTPARSDLDPWRTRATAVCELAASRLARPGRSLADDAAELRSFAARLRQLPLPAHRADAVAPLASDMAELARLRSAAATAAAARNVDDLMSSASTVGEADRLAARWSTWFGKEHMAPCLLVLSPRSTN